MPITAIKTTDTTYNNPYKEFTDTDNIQLYYIAANQAINDNDTQKRNNFTKNLLRIIPVVDSFVAVSQKKQMQGLGAVSTMTSAAGTFGARMLSWGALYLGSGWIFKAVNKLIDKSDTLSKMTDKQPVLEDAIDIAAVYGTYSLARKFASSAKKLVPESVTSLFSDYSEKIAKSINSSNFSKKIYNPLINRITKESAARPQLTSFVKKAQSFAVPTLIFASIVKSLLVDPIALNKKIKGNYHELKKNIA